MASFHEIEFLGATWDSGQMGGIGTKKNSIERVRV